jgi:DNA-binding NarL/FixJ family response regulator
MLVMLARGMKSDRIARECHLSVATVRNHIQRMMAKLDVHTQLEAAAYAYRHGLA